MKFALLTASSLFCAAVAQPHLVHKHRRHGAIHDKRAIVWVTELEVVTETIDITTTLWVNADSTSAPAATTLSQVPAQFFEPASSSAPAPAPVAPTSSSVYVAPAPAPTPTSVYVAPVVVSTPSPTPSPTPAPAAAVSVAPVEVPKVETSTPVAAAVIATTPVAAAAVVPVSTSTPAAAAAPSSSAATSPSSSGYSGSCASTSPCASEITFYDTGMGACGWVDDGTVENVVALPVGLMGSKSNGNPFCGMTITVSKGGKTVTAKVVDKCMGCVNNAIDLSHHAFQQLADESVGRTTAEWWFN